MKESQRLPSKTKLLISALLLLLSIIALTAFSGKIDVAYGFSGADFKPGRIIDDAVFYNSGAMNASQIQGFLNARVPVCDTNGTKPHRSGQTRAQYGTSQGNPPPYICLRDYTQSVPSHAGGGSMLCTGSMSGGNKTAAQIINDVAKSCGINPQVLLVLIQKESSGPLLTDDWPWPSQYRTPTGYGCPDTAPCDVTHYGFYNQVFQAAQAFQRYAKNTNNYNYKAGRNNTIYFHPGPCQTSSGGTCTKYHGHAYRVGGVVRYGSQYASQGPSVPDITYCGSSNVFIENQATANLYIYTPYLPNQAALNSYPGTGNSCSSYGNRNFWFMFNNWFGSTHLQCPSGQGKAVYRLFSKKQARHYYTAFQCEANKLDATSSYKLEGVDFMQPDATEPDRLGVFRLKRGPKWFWTMDPKERDNLTTHHKYRLEGTAFVGLTQHSANEAKLPVYRLYNSTTGGHLWTASAREKDRVSAQKTWRYEGIAYYMLPPQQ